MQVSEATPRRELTIAGAIFKVPQPYTSGHVCNDGEAHALNQTFAENLRNNIAGKMKKGAEGVDWAAAVEEYVAAYEFSVPGERGTRVVLDPIEAEARRLAKRAVVAALKKKSIETKDLAEGQLDKYIDGALEKNPTYREQAATIVAAQKAAASIGLEELSV